MNNLFNLGFESNIIEKYLKTVINKLFDSVVIANRDCEILYFHKKTYFTLTTNMEVGKSIYDYIDKVDKDDFTKDYTRALQGKEVEREKKIRTVMNNISWIKVKYIPIKFPDGNIGGVCITHKDITSEKISSQRKLKYSDSLKKILDEKRDELKKVKEDLDSLKMQHTSFYNNVRDIVFTVDLSFELWDCNLIKASDSLIREMGYMKEDINTLIFGDVIKLHENSIDGEKIMNRLLNDGHITFKANMKAKDGELIPYELNGYITKINNKPRVTFIGRNLLEELEKEKEFRSKLGLDQITNTMNRAEGFRLMDEDMKKSIENKDVIKIVYLDITGLKKINYRFGHLVGDDVLKKFAEIVRKNIDNNTIFFRIDGDEFVLYLKNVGKDYIYNLLANIKDDLRKVNEGNEKAQIQFNYGIATFDGNIQINLDKLIYIAERDMMSKK